MAKFDMDKFVTVEINQKAANVLQLLAGANGGEPLSWTETMDVIALLAATMIDGEPGLKTRRDLRKCTEEFGSTVLTLADQFRLMTDATGQSHRPRLGARPVAVH